MPNGNMGYDADSTAAIAGGLAGIYYGYDCIAALERAVQDTAP